MVDLLGVIPLVQEGSPDSFPKAATPKFTRPDASDLIARERLFTKLDRACSGSLVWVQAPSGMGKTALAASWIESRQLRCTWYRIDASDGDGKDFEILLRGLAECVGVAPAASQALDPRKNAPRRDQEHALVLVVDRYEALADNSPAHTAVSALIRALPKSGLVMLLSRNSPPAEIREFLAYQDAVTIFKGDLLLTREESLALSARFGVRGVIAADLYAGSQGWVALQMLLLRAEPATGSLAAVTLDTDRVHAFFVRNVLETLPAAQQHLVMSLALLPELTMELAQALVDAPTTPRWIEMLADNLFYVDADGRSPVQPHARTGAAMRYHPLLRRSLLRCLEERTPVAELDDLRRKAAALLADRDYPAEAIHLWLQTGARDALAAYVCARARSWIDAGRGEALARLIAAVPASVLDVNPWLLFWRGVAARSRDRLASRRDYRAALGLFELRHDGAGAYLAWAGAVESYFLGWDESFCFDTWIDDYLRLLQTFGTPAALEVEVQVLRAGLALFVFRPSHPLIIGWIERARGLLEVVDAHRDRLSLLMALVLIHNWQGALHESRYLLRRFDPDNPVLQNYPTEFLHVCAWGASALWKALEHNAAFALLATGRALADRLAFHGCDFQLHAQEAFCALNCGDIDRAVHAAAAARISVNHGHGLELGELCLLEANLALAREDGHAVREFIERMTRGWIARAPWPTHNALLTLAQGYNLLERYDEAVDCLHRCVEFARGMPSALLQFSALLTLAWTHLAQGGRRDEAHAVLREALRIGRSETYFNTAPAWLPRPFAMVLAEALEAGIEPAYVRSLILRRELPAPREDLEHWPWTIRIFTLGRFEIKAGSSSIAPSGKVQRRPLDLLRCLIAMGGFDVPVARMIDTVWPDEEGDRARHSFDMALSRLRKLLGNPRAVVLGDGRLSLNSAICWVDANAFESRVKRALIAGEGADSEAPLMSAVELYAGEFLEGEGSVPWVAATRERIRRRYLEAALRLAELRMQRGDPRSALALLEDLADRHPHNETLYQSLMRAHLGLGERVQALDVFARCRAMLASNYGAEPTPALLALNDRARRGG